MHHCIPILQLGHVCSQNTQRFSHPKITDGCLHSWNFSTSRLSKYSFLWKWPIRTCPLGQWNLRFLWFGREAHVPLLYMGEGQNDCWSGAWSWRYLDMLTLNVTIYRLMSLMSVYRSQFWLIHSTGLDHFLVLDARPHPHNIISHPYPDHLLPSLKGLYVFGTHWPHPIQEGSLYFPYIKTQLYENRIYR